MLRVIETVSDTLKVLITGVNGLLGRHAAYSLKEKYEIYGIVRKVPEVPIEGINYLQFDLAENWSHNSLPNDINVVIHLAQSSRFREFPEQALDIFRVNVDATAKLLNYARIIGVNSFVYVSSGGIYGNVNGAIEYNECSPITNYHELNYYLRSKFAGELFVQSYSSFMNVTILRPFFIYGLGQNRSMLIPRIVDMIRREEPISLQGNDGIHINPVHVSDVVLILDACIKYVGYITINVAGSEVFSLRKMAEIIGELIGKKPQFIVDNRDANHLIGNNLLMVSILKRPLVSFYKGVQDVL